MSGADFGFTAGTLDSHLSILGIDPPRLDARTLESSAAQQDPGQASAGRRRPRSRSVPPGSHAGAPQQIGKAVRSD